LDDNLFMKNLVGHDTIKNRLERLFLAGRLPHALLFYGPEGTGKEAAGLEIGKALMCKSEAKPCNKCDSCRLYNNFEHPDFFYLFPIAKPKKDFTGGEWEKAMNESEVDLYRSELEEKKKDLYHQVNFPRASVILIGQIRKLIKTSSLTSYLSGSRFALISSADTMNKEAQNSILKLLEEPPNNYFLCLITSRPDALLPTILSRCQPFYFPVLKKTEIEKGLIEKYKSDPQKAELTAVQANGSFQRARELLTSGDPARTEALDGFLVPILKKQPDVLFNFGKKYERTTDKQFLKNVLIRLDQWLRDLDLLDNGLEPRHNPDLADRLTRFRNNMSYERLNELRTHVLRSVDLIDKNVYIDLILTNLADKFSKHVKIK